MCISVDGRRIRNNKVAFSNLSGIVWTGPESLQDAQKMDGHFHGFSSTGSKVRTNNTNHFYSSRRFERLSQYGISTQVQRLGQNRL